MCICERSFLSVAILLFLAKSTMPINAINEAIVLLNVSGSPYNVEVS